MGEALNLTDVMSVQDGVGAGVQAGVGAGVCDATNAIQLYLVLCQTPVSDACDISHAYNQHHASRVCDERPVGATASPSCPWTANMRQPFLLQTLQSTQFRKSMRKSATLGGYS